MEKENIKSFWIGAILIILIFVVPYVCRKIKNDDIEENKKYTSGIIIKKTGSLNNGTHWHYEFFYNGVKFENYQPTNVEYDVYIGHRYLIEFSYKHPDHNRILYQYELMPNKILLKDHVWNKIPVENFIFHESNGKLW